MHNFPIAICKTPLVHKTYWPIPFENVTVGKKDLKIQFSAWLVQIMRLRSRYCFHFKCAFSQISNDLFTLNEIKSTPAITFTLGQDLIVYCADE